MHGVISLDVAEFASMLECDRTCTDWLQKFRWGNGFCCTECGCTKGYWLYHYRRMECAECGYQPSLTAGTVFHASHVPLKKWFMAIFLMATDKGGLSAMRLHRIIDVTYKTALHMLRKLRSVMGSPGEALLSSIVLEMETILHTPGKEPTCVSLALSGEDEKAELVAVLAPTVGSAIAAHINQYAHRKERPAKSKSYGPMVAGAVTLLKRFFLGTYHRSSKRYLQLYLDEFLFRYKRDNSREILSDLLQRCVHRKPMTITLWEDDRQSSNEDNG